MQEIEFQKIAFCHKVSVREERIENLSDNVMLMIPVTAVVSMVYYLTNHLHWREPLELPLLKPEQQIPFLTWTVWPYLILLLLTYLLVLIQKRELFHCSMLALLMGTLLNAVWWIVLPVTYPRPPMPAGEGLTIALYQWLCRIDSPANCFPSAHITLPAIAFHAMLKQHPRLRGLMVSLFALLSLTILTTKQHYLVDLFGGLVTAWISSRLSTYCYRKASHLFVSASYSNARASL